ncbi:MAG: hypothetical protein AB7I25_13060 [Vicinamibacterales bacterium]
MRGAPVLLMLLLAAPFAEAADPPALVRARTAYNAANYDQAIVLAEAALAQKADADVAALIVVRARLERYRLGGNAADLNAAHTTLRAIARQRLKPREQTELLVAQALALYLDQSYGGAAEVFDSALARVGFVGLTERDRLLEWWALALDREAQALSDDRRRAVYDRIAGRMEQELRDNPSSVSANFWLAAALRGAGNVDRAWDAAMAAWVRVPLDLPGAETLRRDLDRLIVDAVVPERSRQQPRAEWDSLAAGLTSRWEQFKREWQ